jgi:hypothetical protein
MRKSTALRHARKERNPALPGACDAAPAQQAGFVPCSPRAGSAAASAPDIGLMITRSWTAQYRERCRRAAGRGHGHGVRQPANVTRNPQMGGARWRIIEKERAEMWPLREQWPRSRCRSARGRRGTRRRRPDHRAHSARAPGWTRASARRLYRDAGAVSSSSKRPSHRGSNNRSGDPDAP